MADRFAAHEDSSNNEVFTKKKKTKQCKRLQSSILKQIEQYFDGGNLSTNDYFRNLIEDGKFVPLNAFLELANIKDLTDSKKVLAESIRPSKLLELDQTNEKVRRKVPFQTTENRTERTIYVESLPDNVDHNWLSKMFVQFGKIKKITLPKYAKSRLSKGFGFIEFAEVNSVSRVIKSFRVINGVINAENSDAKSLVSAQALNLQRPPKKLKAIQEDNLLPKKQKIEDEYDEKSANTSKNKSNIINDNLFYKLKILSLSDWQILRNQNLKLLHTKRAEIKQKANEELKWRQAAKNLSRMILEKKKTRKQRRQIRKMKKYFETAIHTTPAPCFHLSFKKKSPLQFKYGLIVEMTYKKIPTNIKFLKWNLNLNKNIKYIDIKEGNKIIYLRFETNEAAIEFVKHKNRAKHNCIILNSEAEYAYWSKIESDRKLKRNKQIKIRTKRGREKINSKINKLITILSDEKNNNFQ